MSEKGWECRVKDKVVGKAVHVLWRGRVRRSYWKAEKNCGVHTEMYNKLPERMEVGQERKRAYMKRGDLSLLFISEKA